jgi:hypothetical protein
VVTCRIRSGSLNRCRVTVAPPSCVKLCLACLPFTLLPLLLTPLIPRTRADFVAMPARLLDCDPALGPALQARQTHARTHARSIDIDIDIDSD